jgi:hypothetical protein
MSARFSFSSSVYILRTHCAYSFQYPRSHYAGRQCCLLLPAVKRDDFPRLCHQRDFGDPHLLLFFMSRYAACHSVRRDRGLHHRHVDRTGANSTEVRTVIPGDCRSLVSAKDGTFSAVKNLIVKRLFQFDVSLFCTIVTEHSPETSSGRTVNTKVRESDSIFRFAQRS